MADVDHAQPSTGPAPSDPLRTLVARTEQKAGGDIRHWLTEAQAARHAGRLDDAITLLRAAAQRFPASPMVHHDLARLAEAANDLHQAEHEWRAFMTLSPTVWWAPVHLARALFRQSRLPEAEALLAAACDRFPAEPAPFIEYARVAEMRQHWAEAASRWTAMADRFPQASEALAGQARVLRAQGRTEAARAIMVTALERFPAQTAPLHDLARLAEANRDWTAAERWWRMWLAFETGPWWGYAGLTNALLEQGRTADAEAILSAEFARFGHEPGFFAACGKLTDRANDWRIAADRWAPARNRFPHDWQGYGAQARTLRDQGKAAAADAVLATAAAEFPEQTALAQDLAEAAAARRDWITAARWWRAFLDLRTDVPGPYFALTAALRELRRSDEVASVLAQVLDRFPHDLDALIEIVEQAGGSGGALAPDRLDRVEALLAPHVAQPGANPAAPRAHARIARERRDWTGYHRRLEAMAERWPDDRLTRIMLSEASELALADGVVISAPAPATRSGSGLSDHDLMLSFESLGGGRAAGPDDGRGGGCEFGFVQRSAGAEPLSMLRWATIQPPDLLRGLADGFSRLADGASVSLLAQQHDDWRVHESHYNIQIDHTHLDRAKVTIDEAARMVRARFSFLRRKLIDDLTQGDKIFVYRLADTSIAADRIEALAQAMSRYGQNTLLFVMRDLTQAEPFLIRRQRAGLCVATLAPPPNPDDVIPYNGWLALCRAIHARGV